MMDFSGALVYLKGGMIAKRVGWNGKGMWLKIQNPTALSKMTEPYIYMKTATGGLVPWVASQTDLLSEDWIVSDETHSQFVDPNTEFAVIQAAAKNYDHGNGD